MIDSFELDVIVHEAFRLVCTACPVDKGVLLNSISVVKVKENEYNIRISARHAVYTNEKWVSPKWNGKHNPNEHWIDKVVQEIVQYIAQKVGGTLVSSEGETSRWKNISYWSSPEGQMKLTEYGFR